MAWSQVHERVQSRIISPKWKRWFWVHGLWSEGAETVSAVCRPSPAGGCVRDKSCARRHASDVWIQNYRALPSSLKPHSRVTGAKWSEGSCGPLQSERVMVGLYPLWSFTSSSEAAGRVWLTWRGWTCVTCGDRGSKLCWGSSRLWRQTTPRLWGGCWSWEHQESSLFCGHWWERDMWPKTPPKVEG